MAETPRKRRVTAFQLTVVYVILVVLTGTSYLFSKGNFGDMMLPALLIVAFVEMAIGAALYMHLWEEMASMRFVLPIAVIWVGLLLCITMLDVITRYPPTNPPGAKAQQLPPERPARVRVYQQGGNTPPRMAGF